MQDGANRKNGRQRGALSSDREGTVGDIIRQAFLTHMGEQQRQFDVVPMASRRSAERAPARQVRQPQRTAETAGAKKP
jgi:hypothetical protein